MGDAIDPGFVDAARMRTVAVTGGDALGWLDALVTADLRGIAAGEARRSLLLSPTGAVLATFTVVGADDGLLLFQDPGESRAIGDLLARYVLSADVRLAEGGPQPGEGPGDAWRIAHRAPRVGTDITDGDLPVEAGLDDLVDRDKGCFLGQEAVARVRNTGRPRRILLRLRSDAPLEAGVDVEADGAIVGALTSADASEPGSVAFARIRWDAREADLRTTDGSPLLPA
ncbi:MAG TPA: hypothetical protein VK646_08840 [Actinomycetota bacterium]|nr:hypothetical protein [Actinomycetota bacterium]